jgi:hypothetical protein
MVKKLLNISLECFLKIEIGDEYFLSSIYNSKKFINFQVCYANWKYSIKKYKKYREKYYYYLDKYKETKNEKFKTKIIKYKDKARKVRQHPKLYKTIPPKIYNKKAFFARKFLRNNL